MTLSTGEITPNPSKILLHCIRQVSAWVAEQWVLSLQCELPACVSVLSLCLPDMTLQRLVPRPPLGLFFRVLDIPNWAKNVTLKNHVKITRCPKEKIFSVSG